MPNMSNGQAGANDRLDLNEGEIAPAITPITTQDVPYQSFRNLAASAGELAGTMHQLTAQASQRAGIAAANTDIADGAPPTAKPYGSASSDAYNATIQANLIEGRKASMLGDLQKAEIAHPNDVAGFSQDAMAVGKAYEDNASPFPAADAELRNFFTLQSASSLAKVQQGQETARINNGQAAMSAAIANGSSVLGSAVDSATFDDVGANTVGAAQQQYVQSLAKYGPKTAFDIGDQHFDADPTRLQVATPEQIEANARTSIEKSRASWIYNNAEKLPTSKAQADFRDQVETRYRAGDPVFNGISGPQMDSLNRSLRMLVVHTRSDEAAGAELLKKNAGDLIDAYRWSGDPSLIPQITDAAKRSGDPALIAKANFYASTNAAMPGVLEDVVHNKLDWNTPPGLPGKIASDGDLDNLVNIVIGDEHSPNGSVSPKGARGLMQVEPATAAQSLRELQAAGKMPAGDLDVNRLQNDAAYNRAIGRQYLSDLSQRFDGSVPKILTAYNAGPQAVTDWLSGNNTPWVDAHGGQHNTNPHHVKLPDPDQDPAGFANGIPFTETRNYLARAQKASPTYQAWVGAKSGFHEDPLEFAHTQGAASIPALDPNGAFDPNSQQQFGAALQARLAAGATIGQHYGVPTRMLTNSERDTIAQAIKDDPTKAVSLAQTALQAVGPNGAHMLLKEVGQQSDGPEMHIAFLSATGAAPFANTAIQGMRLKAEGAKEPPAYPPGHRFDDVQATIGSAFQYLPDEAVAARKTAELARLADSTKGLDRDAGYYMQSAVGSTMRGGSQFGGVASMNGRQTLMPSWLRTDQLPYAAGNLITSLVKSGNGPVYSNGQPMSNDDAMKMQIVALPSGEYSLINPKTNGVARDASGQPYRLDFEKNRSWLATRLGPNTVVPGS